ncbi:hypothetical protein ABPG72_012146 [Tetrahymena utriculariae]
MGRATSPFSRGIIITCKVTNKDIDQCLLTFKQIKTTLKQDNQISTQTIKKFYQDWDQNQFSQYTINYFKQNSSTTTKLLILKCIQQSLSQHVLYNYILKSIEY